MDGYPKSNFQSGNILIRDSATPWPRLRQPRQRIVVGWILYKFIPILDIWTCQLQTPPGEKKHWGGSRELWEALALRLSRELWAALMSSGELLGDELWASLASSCSFTIVSKLCHPRKSADWQISGKSICTRGGLVL